MKNIGVRTIITLSGLTFKEVAEKMGISRVWLSTLLRYDLSDKNHKRIMDAIHELQEEKRKVAQG